MKSSAINLLKTIRLGVVRLPRNIKYLIVVIVDVCLCIFTTWLAFYLRLNEFVAFENGTGIAGLVSICVALPLFITADLYRAVFRFSGRAAIQKIGSAMCAYTIVYATAVMVIGLDQTPRTIGIIQPLLLFSAIVASRLWANFWLGRILIDERATYSPPARVIIYGAGRAGRQASVALNDDLNTEVVGFIDDDMALQKRVLNGFPVFSFDDLAALIEEKGSTHCLLAMPSLSRTRRNQILKNLQQYRIAVRTVPSITDITAGRVMINDIKNLDIDDLLGRDPMIPNDNLLTKKVTGKVILITGAGGSIGGELCRQLLVLNPAALLLVDSCEFALYAICNDLEIEYESLASDSGTTVVPILCCIRNFDHFFKILQTWRPHSIYHAAAYKHVPLVEHNVSEGIRNNIFGTINIARAAAAVGVDNCVLISTDKAVRPTNVMGATKRLAEMSFQALQAMTGVETCFSMVRFGNVLASSGSVIPKFREQIERGGPLTLTHPEITRYFMTVSEAAQLVIQASGLSSGGEVFVLDMGQPVKILELAQKMILLSGFSEKSSSNPSGDIEIQITGLRPGEKLYEELLIGKNPTSTEHPKIFMANEAYVAWTQFFSEMQQLESHLDQGDMISVFETMTGLVEGYRPHDKPVDWIYAKNVEGLDPSS